MIYVRYIYPNNLKIWIFGHDLTRGLQVKQQKNMIDRIRLICMILNAAEVL